jgi:plastocyanin
MAAVGDQIVWTNNDRILHRIVMDDGTMVGDVAPGASTGPIALKSATATYHCEIHPSMVGGINVAVAPPPEPYMPPPPPDDPYGYGYGYY